MKKQKSCCNKQTLIIYPHGCASKSRRIIKNKKMTVTGFCQLVNSSTKRPSKYIHIDTFTTFYYLTKCKIIS